VNQIEQSLFWQKFFRVDISSPDIRIFGHVSVRMQQTVFVIETIRIATALQNQGLFTALVKEINRRFGLPVYLKGVINEEWEAKLSQSPHWQKAIEPYSFIQKEEKPNDVPYSVPSTCDGGICPINKTNH